MTPVELHNVLCNFKYPNTSFLLHCDSLNPGWVVQIIINEVIDVFTGKKGPLTTTKTLTLEYIKYLDEQSAKDHVRMWLHELIIHDADENIQYNTDRPWYPHGFWNDRKHLVELNGVKNV